jgi:hypothetical protein
MKTTSTLFAQLLTFFMLVGSLSLSALPVSSSAFGNEKSYSVVSPNPAQNLTTITFHNPTEDMHSIELFDVLGSKIATYNHIEKSRYVLDVSELNAGVYFYFIMKDNVRVSTGRLIVKH